MPTLQEEYFQSYSNYFWQWEEQQSVVSIPGESTIAYTEFVGEAIAAIAPRGLPPFGSLLLAIVGTNPKAEESLEEIDKIILPQIDPTEDLVLRDALQFLLTLGKLPAAYKTGEKRLMVLQTIFRDCHYIRSISDSNTLSTIFAHSTFSKRSFVQLPFNQKNYYRDFRVLDLLNTKFPSPSSIIDSIANIPALEKEQLKLEENTGPEKTKEDLVDQLIDHSKTFHVGSLVKRIWSGLNIPVHSTLPSDQPIGGFSDLSNKGDFDRLLLSEFANDDLLFLSRLANNEALYIEREIPPANNKLERVILIDASLRNWGTPKTVAFATMLAIARHPKTSIACKVYVIGKKFHPVSIENVDRIIDGLQIVEGELHPAKGLDAFFKEFPSPQNREVFVITEPSTLRQGEMLRAMYDHQPLINYVIYTDALGNIDVYKKQQSSKRHIQHLLLPLGELWTKQSPKKETFPSPAGNREQNEQLPQFPILVKPAANTRVLLSTAEGELFQVTPERFLLRFFDRSAKYYSKGWEILYTNLPVISGEFEIGQVDRTITLLMLNPQNKQLHLLNLSNGTIHTIAFNQWRSDSSGFIFKDGCFLYRSFSGTNNWRIYPDGKLEEIPSPNVKLFEERKKEVLELDKKVYSAGGILKNIDSVYINGESRLVLNIHELKVDENNYIRLDNHSNRKQNVVAEREHRDTFAFKDGSKVEVNRSGFVILTSSNPSIPPIYVPTMMDATLGVATHTSFAGNTYYFREPLYEVHLEKAGSNKLALIKSIKDVNNQSLVAVKDLVDSGSGLISQYVAKERALNIQIDLEKQDAKIKLVNMQNYYPDQGLMDPRAFFNTYINPFIDHILAHGA
jgi:ribosomal protein L7/L12